MVHTAELQTIDDILACQPKTLFQRTVLDEQSFQRMIVHERKRTDRSRSPFLLILLEAGNSVPAKKKERFLTEVADVLVSATRETDIVGWYDKSSIGLLVTEIQLEERRSIVSTVLRRIIDAMGNSLLADCLGQINISVCPYPENWEYELFHRPSDPKLYPDLVAYEKENKTAGAIKRAIDILGGVAGLVLFSPLFILLPIAIKLTSPGPILFRQLRVGTHGRTFMFFKFRSMHANNNADVHVQWFNQFISGNAESYSPKSTQTPVYKLTNDPRITPLGRILRRTSLDELPQFFNVLRGDMSLVGPRPPIPYEVNTYSPWHRGRVLYSKPGITGLWQVSGRSRVTFDEMVRLDIQYARNWSLLLDLKILLQTPRAVVSADGAY